MGITGLLPFIEKISRRANINEFNGCTVAIDSYCWLHKGAFACADRLVRGEDTDVHIKYCLKYVNMLLSNNIKPILVFDGRHLPAKAQTENKRRESRQISKKRAAELLSLGKVEEARSYIRRAVDITHEMALSLIRECRKRNVDCIVAPYEADAQLAYLNVRNIAQLVITEDSDLILFGCTKVLFKMDISGTGTLVETVKLPLVMRCPIERYSFEMFRRMCIMSGCDYLPSLPGVGLAKARQFVVATQDPDFANALKKLPSYLNKPTLTVSDEYRAGFLKAEATFKHQYVYDPIQRTMVRLTEPDDEEQALCTEAGKLLDPDIAFQLALGNLDPFTLKTMDQWHPDTNGHTQNKSKVKDNSIAPHPTIWSPQYQTHMANSCPWAKPTPQPNPAIAHTVTRPRKKVVNMIVPETQDESLSIQTLSNMYCVEPSTKKQKADSKPPMLTDDEIVRTTSNDKSPILVNKRRSYIKSLEKGHNILKRLSRFPRTIVDDHNIVESKFFPTTSLSEDANTSKDSLKDESPEKSSKNPFKITPENQTKNPFKVYKSTNSIYAKESCNRFDTSDNDEKTHQLCNDLTNEMKVSESANEIDKETCNQFDKSYNDEKPLQRCNNLNKVLDVDSESCRRLSEEKTSDSLNDRVIIIDDDINSSQKENSPCNSPVNRSFSPILKPSPRNKRLLYENSIKLETSLSEDSIIENTYPMETLVTPMDSQESFGLSQKFVSSSRAQTINRPTPGVKSTCRVSGLKRTTSLTNQPTLLSKFGFQKKPVLKRR